MHQKQPEETPYIPTKLLEETVSPETKAIVAQLFRDLEESAQARSELLSSYESKPMVLTTVIRRTIDKTSPEIDENPYAPPRIHEESTVPSASPESKALVEECLLRNEAFSQSARELLFLDENDPTIITTALHRTIDNASAAAEATIDLVLSLIKAPSTPEIDSLLASHLAELKPGPYSDLVIKSLAESTHVTGEIKQALTATLANWQESYGDNPIHTNDISRLSALLAPKSLLASITDTFKRLFGAN